MDTPSVNKSTSKNWIRSLLLAGLVSVFLYFVVMFTRNLHILFNFNDYFTEAQAEAFAKVGDKCDASFEHVREIFNVHSLKEAEAIIATSNGPLIFRDFLSDPKWLLEKILEAGENVTFGITKVQVHGFGNIFLGGVTPIGMVNTTLNALLSGEQDIAGVGEGLKEGDDEALFASFLPMAKQLDIGDLLTGIAPQNAALDTNFASNFPRDVLSTGIHAAAFAHSLSVQVVGTKMWLMGTPQLMEQFTAYSTPATLPLTGSEVEFFQKTRGRGSIAVQNPGDLFYFPPHWPHAVITKAGPNLMLNFRIVDVNPLNHLLAGNLFRLLVGLSGVIVEWTSKSNAFSHQRSKLADTTRRQLMGEARRRISNFDSPCTAIWRDIMHDKL